jgi:hypothetical protein
MDTQDQPASPQESPSIADKIAAKFGVTEDEPTEAAPPTPEEADASEGTEAPAEEFAEVEYEGARYQVPKALEKAILQEKDYTQKTQTVANKQREFEALAEQGRLMRLRTDFESSVEAELSQLKAYDQVLNQQVDWSKLSDQEAFRTQLQRNQWKEERDSIARTLQGKQQQFGQSYEKAISEAKAKSLDAISKQIPNFSDAVLKEIREHAKGDGYTDVELNTIDLDPRHIKTLYKAKQYDALMASKAQAVQTANKAPPMVKPGTTRPMPQAVKNELALRKAQANAKDSSAVARIIQQRLEGRF